MLLFSILERECEGKDFDGIAYSPFMILFKKPGQSFAEVFVDMVLDDSFFDNGLDAVNVMRESFEKLPLHVNEKSPEARAVFIWRMEIGR